MKRLLLLVAAALLLDAAALAEPVWVGRFGEGGEGAEGSEGGEGGEGGAAWRDVTVSDQLRPTRYVPRVWDGVAAIEAHAERSMSLYARPLAIDLQTTPVLCWRWRIDAPLQAADMATKAGDDYAARVYVSFALPPERLDFGTRAKLALGRAIWGEHLPDAALNYVWDNRQPVGTTRPNAYTDRTRMVVAQSGAAEAGGWVVQRHDVARDFAAAFGSAEGIRPVQLAIASDTDNTGEAAHSGFADFHFVAREAPCAFAAPLAARPEAAPVGKRE